MSHVPQKDRGHIYLIALGSNMRHHRFGSPQRVLAAALERMRDAGLAVLDRSRVITTPPLGPSHRNYANAVCIVAGALGPLAMLYRLQSIEDAFGRSRQGQRWRQRVLDLDIVLWSGGIFVSPRLVIPHPQFRIREFVLGPAAAIAPGWRDPVSALSLRQLEARLTRPRTLPR